MFPGVLSINLVRERRMGSVSGWRLVTLVTLQVVKYTFTGGGEINNVLSLHDLWGFIYSCVWTFFHSEGV